MSRTQTFLALAAVVFASVAGVQVPGRLIFAAIAIALLLGVGAARLRAALTSRRQAPSTFDAAERAARIREERRRRMGG